MEERIFQIVAEVLNIPITEASEDLSVGDIPSWDSMAHAKLIVAIEAEFKIQFDMDEALDIEGVGDIIDILSKRGIENNS